MAGQIHAILGTILLERGRGNHSIEANLRAKIALKGVDTEAWNQTSEDDPEVLARVRAIASEMNVEIPS